MKKLGFRKFSQGNAQLTLPVQVSLACIKKSQGETWTGVTEMPEHRFLDTVIQIEQSADVLGSTSTPWRWQP